MKNKTQNLVKGPKALFWYLVLFLTLGIVAFSAGALWFQYINKFFPQEIIGSMVQKHFGQNALRFAIAGLLVATPIFFVFNWLIRKSLKNKTLDTQSKIKIWITYIILFIIIAVAVGDLITTVFKLLGGDFTLRFILKSLTILIVAGWIFAYYGLESKSADSLTNSKIPLIMALISLGLIIVSFIGAFFIVESPFMARLKAFDATRVMNLSEIRYAINNFYIKKGNLPKNLEELKDFRVDLNINDPDTKTKRIYEYKITATTTYELCAYFDTSNKEGYEGQPYSYHYYPEPGFSHDIGYRCFDLKINPNLMVPLKEPRQVPAATQ